MSLNENGTVKSVDPFITGFIENNSYRPPRGQFAAFQE